MKPKNCWECENCCVIGDGAYVGWHKCMKLSTGNVEHYANKVNPICPVGYAERDESEKEGE